jgi:selenocysteine-specific elongation factor
MTVNVGDRLIFRDQGATRTIASGIVVDPSGTSRGRAKSDRIAILQQLASRTQKEDYADVLIENTLAGVPITTLTRSLNWHTEKVRDWLSRRPDILLIDTYITAKKHFEATKTQLLTTLSQFHQNQPNAAGIDLSVLSATLPSSTLYTNAAIESLKSTKKILVSGTQVRLPSAKVELPVETERLLKNLLPLLAATPLQPPVIHDLAQSLNLTVKTLQQRLQPAVKAGMLVQPVKNRVFRPESLVEMRDCITNIATDEGFTVQQFRDTTGIGRNLCIELLEYFDARGLTRREGNVRYLRS